MLLVPGTHLAIRSHTMSTIESIPPPTDVNAASASGQANEAPAASLPPKAIEGFDRWVKGFQKYESVLVRSHSRSSI